MPQWMNSWSWTNLSSLQQSATDYTLQKNDKCPELKVHENIMKTAQKEKYLGHIIKNDGKLNENIENRIAKAWSYFAKIRGLIN